MKKSPSASVGKSKSPIGVGDEISWIIMLQRSSEKKERERDTGPKNCTGTKTMSIFKGLCCVVGAGPGLGGSVASCFAKNGYKV